MKYDIEVKVTGLEGACRAGHKIGDIFKVSPLNAGGLCGAAYHAIFPMLMMLDMDGKLPWDPTGNVAHSACPDLKNLLSMEIHRIPKTGQQ
ncbi:MAG TPA: TIGR04076 family protein [Candidatus Kapabacteria bacterium]|nr:TIGR04076 family protein [Candidatus Kapabacteria bacterium]